MAYASMNAQGLILVITAQGRSSTSVGLRRPKVFFLFFEKQNS